MSTAEELRAEEVKMTKTNNHTLLALAGCLCMVSGLISFVCGNPISGCAMTCVGLSDLALVIYYRKTEGKAGMEK